MIQKIAMIGATGTLGRPVAHALVKEGFFVTALVRDEAKAKNLLPAAVTLQVGDLDNPADLDQLFKDQDAVYINLNLNPSFKQNDPHPEREGLQKILAAAKKANLRRVGLISSLVKNYQGMDGFHWWVFDMKLAAVEMVRNCSIPYTIFYPSTFMENFETNYKRGNRILLAGKSIAPQWFIAGEDYGRQVARSFRHLTAENKEYNAQGPAPYTTGQAADIYLMNNPNKNLTLSKAPLGMLRFLGKFIPQIHYGAHIIEALNNYSETFVSEDTWRELGKPEITLEKYAASQS